MNQQNWFSYNIIVISCHKVVYLLFLQKEEANSVIPSRQRKNSRRWKKCIRVGCFLGKHLAFPLPHSRRRRTSTAERNEFNRVGKKNRMKRNKEGLVRCSGDQAARGTTRSLNEWRASSVGSDGRLRWNIARAVIWILGTFSSFHDSRDCQRVFCFLYISCNYYRRIWVIRYRLLIPVVAVVIIPYSLSLSFYTPLSSFDLEQQSNNIDEKQPNWLENACWDAFHKKCHLVSRAGHWRCVLSRISDHWQLLLLLPHLCTIRFNWSLDFTETTKLSVRVSLIFLFFSLVPARLSKCLLFCRSARRILFERGASLECRFPSERREP